MDLGEGGTDPSTGNPIATTFQVSRYAKALAGAHAALAEVTRDPSVAGHRKASAAFAKAAKSAPTQEVSAQHASAALAHANAALMESHTMRRNG